MWAAGEDLGDRLAVQAETCTAGVKDVAATIIGEVRTMPACDINKIETE